MNSLTAEHCCPVHRVNFDPNAPGQPTSAIVSAIETVTDTPPLEMDPLYESIEVDALERLFDHAATSAATPASIGLEFAVEGRDVVVSGEGQVLVYDANGCENDGEFDS